MFYRLSTYYRSVCTLISHNYRKTNYSFGNQNLDVLPNVEMMFYSRHDLVRYHGVFEMRSDAVNLFVCVW